MLLVGGGIFNSLGTGNALGGDLGVDIGRRLDLSLSIGLDLRLCLVSVLIFAWTFSPCLGLGLGLSFSFVAVPPHSARTGTRAHQCCKSFVAFLSAALSREVSAYYLRYFLAVL